MKKLFYSFNLLTLCLILGTVTARAQAPTITSAPVNDSVCTGATATFTVATSDTSATYMWLMSTDGGTTWTTDTASMTATLHITSVTSAMSGYMYKAIVSDTSGADTSSSASLYVRPAASAGTISGAATVCPGGTTTLTPSIAGGVWSSSMATIATVSTGGVVTGVSAGADSIWYTVTNICGAAHASHVVTVSAATTSGTIFGPSTMCIGSTIMLTDSISGGVWMSMDSTATISSTGMLTGEYLGQDTVIYIVSNSCGTDTSMFAIAVQAVTVSPITGSTNVCSGSSATLADASAGGTWSSSDTTIARVTSAGVVSGVAVGVVTISYNVTVSCGTTLVTTMDTVRTVTIGSITGVTNVCAGDTITLSDTTLGGTWSSTDTSIAKAFAGGIVTGVSYGRDTIIYTDSTACGYVSVSFPITVGYIPTGTISGPSYVCQGSSITLTESISGGVWSSSNTALATVDGFGGVYGSDSMSSVSDTIFYTVTNACGTARAMHLVFIDTTVTAAPITGATNVCVGSYVTLHNVNAGSRGAWTVTNSNASVASTGNVTGNVTGMDTVIYVYTNSCNSVTSTRTITIDSSLTAGTISASTSTVCRGSGVTFSASMAGGYWISSDYSVAIPDTSGFVVGRSAGTAVISYTFVNSCGAFVATDTLHVISPASMIAGPDSVGVGATITVYDSVVGGTFTSSDTTIATVNATTGLVSGLTGGVVTITYTVSNVCGTTMSTKVIHVDVAPYVPAIAGVDTVCSAGYIMLTDSISGGVWSATNSNASVNDSGVVTGFVPYSYDTIKYSYTNAFGTTVVSKVVYINGAPIIHIAGPVSVVIGDSYTFVDTPSTGIWVSLNPTAVTFISSNTFVALHGGVTPLVYYATNACGTSTDTFTVNLPVIGAVATVNNVVDVLNVYPNPNTGNFSLNMISSVDEDVTVSITNMVGEKVKDLKVTTNKVNNISLGQPAGVYLLEAVTSHGKYSTKVTVNE